MPRQTKNKYIRIARNILFWALFTFYHYEGKGNFPVHYPALFITLIVSYGIPCYINNLFLIPRFLLKHRYIIYTGLFIVLLALTSVGSYYSTNLLNGMFPDINYMGDLKNVAIPYHAFPSMLMFVLLAFGKFTADAISNQRRMDQLEKQTLETELENLKSQINPHFLFNALNTIYGMARRTDIETADAVMKLSDILRHNLYDCNEDRIPLEKEIEFLKHYIEFAKLRIYDKTKIQMEVNTANTHPQKIAPLLLIPFVENAIKHGIGKHSGSGWVQISISVTGGELHFVCSNSNYNKRLQLNDMSSYGGIGFKNAKRRLELLYPDAHELLMTDDAEVYKIDLKIQLA